MAGARERAILAAPKMPHLSFFSFTVRRLTSQDFSSAWYHSLTIAERKFTRTAGSGLPRVVSDFTSQCRLAPIRARTQRPPCNPWWDYPRLMGAYRGAIS